MPTEARGRSPRAHPGPDRPRWRTDLAAADERDVACHVCGSTRASCARRSGSGAGAVLLTEEALGRSRASTSWRRRCRPSRPGPTSRCCSSPATIAARPRSARCARSRCCATSRCSTARSASPRSSARSAPRCAAAAGSTSCATCSPRSSRRARTPSGPATTPRRANRLKDEFLATAVARAAHAAERHPRLGAAAARSPASRARVPTVLEIVARNAQSQAQLISACSTSRGSSPAGSAAPPAGGDLAAPRATRWTRCGRPPMPRRSRST